MGPNVIVALTAHHIPNLMPRNGSTEIVCRLVSVLLTFTQIFKLVDL